MTYTHMKETSAFPPIFLIETPGLSLFLTTLVAVEIADSTWWTHSWIKEGVEQKSYLNRIESHKTLNRRTEWRGARAPRVFTQGSHLPAPPSRHSRGAVFNLGGPNHPSNVLYLTTCFWLHHRLCIVLKWSYFRQWPRFWPLPEHTQFTAPAGYKSGFDDLSMWSCGRGSGVIDPD